MTEYIDFQEYRIQVPTVGQVSEIDTILQSEDVQKQSSVMSLLNLQRKSAAGGRYVRFDHNLLPVTAFKGLLGALSEVFTGTGSPSVTKEEDSELPSSSATEDGSSPETNCSELS
jgi:hypothetical protein